MKIIKFVSIFLCLGAISACGTTSSLKSASGANEKVKLKKYDRVVVLDFENGVHQGNVLAAKAGIKFADAIATSLSQTGAFKEVSRVPSKDTALVITGKITEYDDGDAVLKTLVGFAAGNANFNADVFFKDNETNRTLGSIDVDKNSYAGGGMVAASQTADTLMNDSIEKIISELKLAKLDN